MNVIVDTSVWSLSLRRKPEDLNSAERSITNELAELIKEGRAVILGVIRQDLLSGIRMDEQYEKLKTFLRGFPDEPIEIADHEAAAKASNYCRGRGVTLHIVDVLICAVASRSNSAIFTTDPDFQNYAKLLSVRLHVPRK